MCWTLCERHHLEGWTLGGREEVGVQWIGRAAKSRVWDWVAGQKPSEEERGGWGVSGSGKAGEIQTVKAPHRFAVTGPREAPEVGEQGT